MWCLVEKNEKYIRPTTSCNYRGDFLFGLKQVLSRPFVASTRLSGRAERFPVLTRRYLYHSSAS